MARVERQRPLLGQPGLDVAAGLDQALYRARHHAFHALLGVAQQLLDAAAVLAANLTFELIQATTGRSDMEVGDGLDELLRPQPAALHRRGHQAAVDGRLEDLHVLPGGVELLGKEMTADLLDPGAVRRLPDAANVVLNNPVPEGTAYVADSAFGKGTKIIFSVDGGKQFDVPSRLTVETQKSDGSMDTQAAGPEQYTHIRWTIAEVPAGKSLTLGYEAKVK